MKVRTNLHVPRRVDLLAEAVALIERLARIDWEAHKIAGPFLARVKRPVAGTELYRAKEPDPFVVDAKGRVKPHPFEEAHDDPAPCVSCWYCYRPRWAPIHIKPAKSSPAPKRLPTGVGPRQPRMVYCKRCCKTHAVVEGEKECSPGAWIDDEP